MEVEVCSDLPLISSHAPLSSYSSDIPADDVRPRRVRNSFYSVSGFPPDQHRGTSTSSRRRKFEFHRTAWRRTRRTSTGQPSGGAGSRR